MFLQNEPLMSALTQSAATFVAILAGFYTTKILTIAGDKNRIEHKLNYLKSEISFETENIKNLKIEINNIQEEDDNDLLLYFIETLKDESHFPSFPKINTLKDLIIYYEKNFQKKPSENLLRKLKQQSDSIISQLKVIRTESLKKNTFSSTLVPSSSHSDIGSRIIESNRTLEEQRSYNELVKELAEKENKFKFLNQQYSLYNEELHSVVYPKHLKLGFISFGLFAILGVVIPLMHQWWYPAFNENSDAFAFIMFLIGLSITFAYILLEIRSILKKSNGTK